MDVLGRVLVNGRPVPAGTNLTVHAGNAGPFAFALVGPEGAFSVRVPGDDPATAAREGPAAGDPLSFRLLDGQPMPTGVTFAPGGRRETNLTFLMPDLVVGGVEAAPTTLLEGREVVLRGSVANRGNATASHVRVAVVDAGRTVGVQAFGILTPGASLPFEVRFKADVQPGNRTLLAAPLAQNGDGHPATGGVPFLLQVLPDAPPVVSALRHDPPAPRAGTPVTLHAEVSDADGVASVRFFWSTEGAGVDVAEVNASPYRVPIGVFPANATVRYWVVATDAGPLNRSTTTPAATFTVPAASGSPGASQGGGSGGPQNGTTPPPTNGTGPTGGGGDAGKGRIPGAAPVHVLVAAGAASALLAQSFRRRPRT